MSKRMNSQLFLLSVQLVAFWPVWHWYFARMFDGSDDPWGILALGTLIVLAATRRPVERVRGNTLMFQALCTGLYAATYSFVPPLARAMVAVISISPAISRHCIGRSLHPSVLGLLGLSLPVMSSLQFYLGYPLRVVTGMIAVPLLEIGGLAAVREGTCIRWGADLISIDAPCAGIRMLWAGLFLTFVLAAYYRLGSLKTLAITCASIILIILGNVFRATALFYSESGIVQMPTWSHDLSGVITFVGVGAAICWAIHYVGRDQSCSVRWYS